MNAPKTEMDKTSPTVAVMCVGGYVLAIPRYGVWGAAWATLLAFTVIAVISMGWVYRLWPYQIEFRRVGIVVLSLVAAVAVFVFVPVDSVVGQVMMGIGLCACFPVAIWGLGFLTPGERAMISRGPELLQQRWRALGAGKTSG